MSPLELKIVEAGLNDLGRKLWEQHDPRLFDEETPIVGFVDKEPLSELQ